MKVWDRKAVELKIVELVREGAKTDCEVRMDSHIYADLGFDSMEHVELVINIEEAFGIVFPDKEVVGRFVDLTLAALAADVPH